MTAPGLKSCGQCGFKNSPAKKYCDQCGTVLISPNQSEIPQTAIRRSVPEPPLPEEAGLRPAFLENKAPAPTQSASWTVMRRRDRVHNLGFLFILTILAALGAYRYSLYVKPQNAVPRLAAEYLRALQGNQLEKAYGMLSSLAKANCSLEEFKAARSPLPWTYSDIKAVRIEPEAAVVRYLLSPQDGAAKDDYLHFIREEGGWARPYNWTLLRKAEAALERNDIDMALLLSQAAVEINPRDPMARGYLCEAAFHRRASQDAERECSQALRLSALYPSALSAKSLLHLHSLLGDTYKDSLGRPAEAVKQYQAALALPGLAAADRCRLLLASSAAKAAMGQSAPAADEMRQAFALCPQR